MRTPDMNFEHQKQLIRRDLASFADPGTVSLNEDRRSILATWRIRRRQHEATFYCQGTSGIEVEDHYGRTQYADFLAGTEMANLRQVAQSIQSTIHNGIFVETKCIRSDDTSDPVRAIKMLTDLVNQPIGDRTEVIIVTGQAGTGKTHILRELVQRQASLYLSGQSKHLFLYVNAQGRALARLHEAFATELQDLRVALTYHSIATLTRTGTVVPVIDGFDELLGVSGYDDAFSPLANFLDQLGGEGKIIASARSVYYEEEFRNRGNQFSTAAPQYWSHTAVRIHDWDSNNQQDFLKKLAQQQHIPTDQIALVNHRLDQVFRNSKELRSKPFYFVTLSNLLLNDGPDLDVGASTDLLEILTEALLRREQAEKLLDEHQRPLLSIDQLRRLLNEIAEEMWHQETRELDLASVRFVAEYVLESHTMGSSFETVTERMPSLAFLAPPKDRIAGQFSHQQLDMETVGFEHEAFFFYFLSCAIVERYLDTSYDMKLLLSRSPLPQFVADRVAMELEKKKKLAFNDDLKNVIDRCSSAGRELWIKTVQVQENVGQIILAILENVRAKCKGSIRLDKAELDSVIFLGGDFHGVEFSECTLKDTTMRRTRLENARFRKCIFHNCFLHEVRVDPNSTVLDLRGLEPSKHVLGLDISDAHMGQTTYDLTTIIQVLKDCGMKSIGDIGAQRIRPVNPNIVRIMDRLMRAFRRSNPISTADRQVRRIITDRDWEGLLEALIRHRIVEQIHRPIKRRQIVYYRCRLPASQVMMGQAQSGEVMPEVAEFWRSLSG